VHLPGGTPVRTQAVGTRPPLQGLAWIPGAYTVRPRALCPTISRALGPPSGSAQGLGQERHPRQRLIEFRDPGKPKKHSPP